jgi:hypothetical protein
MCKFLEELKSLIPDEKIKKKIRKKQMLFLEDPKDIQFYEKKKGNL